MIKRLATVLTLLLAVHFLAVVGAVGYLFGTGKLDGPRLREIAKIVNPAPVPPTTKPAAESADAATTQPLLRFDALLATQTGKTASEQVQFLRDTFDGMSAQLDRQQRSLLDLQRTVDAAQAKLAQDRAAVEGREKAIGEREQQQAMLASDAGFQRTLEIYDTMSTKQLKDALVSQDDALVARYLQNMEPKRVSSILKEFKTPDELKRANALLERLRTLDLPTPDAAATSAAAPR